MSSVVNACGVLCGAYIIWTMRRHEESWSWIAGRMALFIAVVAAVAVLGNAVLEGLGLA